MHYVHFSADLDGMKRLVSLVVEAATGSAPEPLDLTMFGILEPDESGGGTAVHIREWRGREVNLYIQHKRGEDGFELLHYAHFHERPWSSVFLTALDLVEAAGLRVISSMTLKEWSDAALRC